MSHLQSGKIKSAALPLSPLAAIATLSNADVVTENRAGKVWTVMLKHRVSGKFAVCAIDTSRAIVTALNYREKPAQARLLGNLSTQGVLSVLDWTDRLAALYRYAGLVNSHSTNTDESVVSLLPKFGRDCHAV